MAKKLIYPLLIAAVLSTGCTTAQWLGAIQAARGIDFEWVVRAITLIAGPVPATELRLENLSTGDRVRALCVGEMEDNCRALRIGDRIDPNMTPGANPTTRSFDQEAVVTISNLRKASR